MEVYPVLNLGAYLLPISAFAFSRFCGYLSLPLGPPFKVCSHQGLTTTGRRFFQSTPVCSMWSPFLCADFRNLGCLLIPSRRCLSKLCVARFTLWFEHRSRESGCCPGGLRSQQLASADRRHGCHPDGAPRSLGPPAEWPMLRTDKSSPPPISILLAYPPKQSREGN